MIFITLESSYGHTWFCKDITLLNSLLLRTPVVGDWYVKELMTLHRETGNIYNKWNGRYNKKTYARRSSYQEKRRTKGPSGFGRCLPKNDIQRSEGTRAEVLRANSNRIELIAINKAMKSVLIEVLENLQVHSGMRHKLWNCADEFCRRYSLVSLFVVGCGRILDPY